MSFGVCIRRTRAVWILINTHFELHLAKCSGGLPLALFGAYLWTSCAGDLLPADSRQKFVCCFCSPKGPRFQIIGI